MTETGHHVVKLLDDRRYAELRRIMISAHLATYDNLRALLDKHLELGALWRPILEAGVPITETTLRSVLSPAFGDETDRILESLAEQTVGLAGKKAEDAILACFLAHYFGKDAMGIPLFRALCDRLISLRVLNMMRVSFAGREFSKSYSTATRTDPPEAWYVRVTAATREGDIYNVYVAEPDMTSKEVQQRLLTGIQRAFEEQHPEAGYYDLPDVRDFVCEKLRIPEAAFDEGVIRLLDWRPSPLTVAFRYERISARRKPLVRTGDSTQLYNLLRGS